MGMSTWVEGFKPPNDKWKAMKIIWEACEEAGIEIPKKVYDYFEGEPPDEAGVRVEIPCKDYDDGIARSGVEIDLAKISKDVKMIRFGNSW